MAQIDFKNLQGKFGSLLAYAVMYFKRSLGTISQYDIWIGTQAAYDALPSYDSNTIYFIEEPVV